MGGGAASFVMRGGDASPQAGARGAKNECVDWELSVRIVANIAIQIRWSQCSWVVGWPVWRRASGRTRRGHLGGWGVVSGMGRGSGGPLRANLRDFRTR